VARGNASKFFHPFILPGDLKGSSEEVKNKLLVNFDPLRCFVGDLEASIFNAMTIIFEEWIFLFTFSLDICRKSSPTCSRYGMILWEVMLLA
jgi:hypothetical protein